MLQSIFRVRLGRWRPSVGIVSLLSLLVTQVVAQSNSSLSGTVHDGAGVPVEYAAVALHRATDSVVVKTEFSDAQGHFWLAAPTPGQYLVSVALVGYQRTWSAPLTAGAAALVLGVLTLQASSATTLKEVTVAGSRPLYEREADRTIVNVEGNTLSAGANSLDVLGRAPGVTLNANDELALRGKQGVLVLLDGKRVPVSGADLADLLRSLPADQVRTIELITNPPAKYDVQGGAGIIAINLKKDQRLGTNGNTNVSYGRGQYGKFVGGISLNHRREGLNLFGSYSYADRQGFRDLDFDRIFYQQDGTRAGASWQINRLTNHLQSHTGKIGADYSLSKRTLVGVAVSSLASQTPSYSRNQSYLYDEQSNLTGLYNSTTDQTVKRPNVAANLNLRHVFADSAGSRELTFDADYARYRTRRLLDLTTTYMVPAQLPSILRGDQHSNVQIQSLKTDYSQPLPHRTRLEAGAKVTWVRSDNDVAFNNVVDRMMQLATAISSQFNYQENVNAAYASLKRAYPKTSVQVGLRAEQTNTLGRQYTPTDARFERHYLQLFPSALVQRTLSEQHALSLSFNRRIDRPTFGQVSPLRVYSDPTSYSTGNPALYPQTSYNLEIAHTYRQKFSTSLSYSRTINPFLTISQPSPDGGLIVVQRDENLASLGYYALTLTAPLQPTKWWSVYTNAVVFYNHFTTSLPGTTLRNSQPAFTANSSSSFTLGHDWTLDVSGLYQSREVYGFEIVQPRGQVSAGLQKSLWDRQATLRLNVTDIFYTTPIRSAADYGRFAESFYARQDLRVGTLSFTYKFGNGKVTATRKRITGADEDQRRANGL